MLYGICTDGRRESRYVPARNCIEMEGRFPMIHKNLNNQRRLWWARQGLNLRPHPCEGCALPLSYAPAEWTVSVGEARL